MDDPGKAQLAPLPPAVEELIQAICREKSQPPLDNVSRRRLVALGERESVRILSEIRGNSTKVRNFSALVVYLVKSSPLRCCSSSITPPRSTVGGSGSPMSPLSRPWISPVSPAGNTLGNESSPNKRRRALDLSDEVLASFLEHFTGSPAINEAVAASKQVSDSVLDVLGKLEFKKAFLILNYCGRKKLEDVISADKIRLLQMIENMDSFETQIWNEFGRVICKENDRRKYIDWGSAASYSYQCNVYADGSRTFKGPFVNKTTTLLHKVLGDENVLMVKLAEEETDSNTTSSLTSPAWNKVIEDGIIVGQKCYRFFVYKDGGKEEKKKSPTSSPVKCYFVNMEAFSIFFEKGPQVFKIKSIQEARSMFMHIHQAPTLANYMARFSLILSKTVTLDANFDDVNVQDIPDVPCVDEYGNTIYGQDGKPCILTDGTGFISEDLSMKCPQNCFKGIVLDNRNIQLQRFVSAFPHVQELTELNAVKSPSCEPPLLIQFRMFHQGRAIKGTVLVNKKLPPSTIQVRPSMIKVETDRKFQGAPSVSKFEIVGTSNKPKYPRLSKNLIALLHYGGVPKEFFLDILRNSLMEAKTFLRKKRAALKVAISRDADEDLTVARMILSGIPLDEPFLQHRLSVISKDELKNLRAGKLPIDDSYYVMGTADPTGTLNPGEVCVILEHGQISGQVLVYRNPGIHPGDVHVVEATYVKALEDIVGNSKYAIFFPAKGPRSMADEIAGGDYDGDMYWVSRNPELLKYFKPSPPWTCTSPPAKVHSEVKPSDLSEDVLECNLFRLCLNTRFKPSKAMGMAADCWLHYMDRILTLQDDCTPEKKSVMNKITKLIDKYYDALDAPKKGKTVDIPKDLIPKKYPHHMERGEFCTYKSTSILGQIHDEVDNFNNFDPIQVWRLPCFQKHIEQIPATRLESWKAYYKDYRSEMITALNAGDESKNESALAVYRKYKKVIYGVDSNDDADELEKSRKAWKEIRVEALSAYSAAYDHAFHEADPQKCNFAWKVAGSALFKIFMEEQAEKPIQCLPSVVKEMFC